MVEWYSVVAVLIRWEKAPDDCQKSVSQGEEVVSPAFPRHTDRPQCASFLGEYAEELSALTKLDTNPDASLKVDAEMDLLLHARGTEEATLERVEDPRRRLSLPQTMPDMVKDVRRQEQGAQRGAEQVAAVPVPMVLEDRVEGALNQEKILDGTCGEGACPFVHKGRDEDGLSARPGPWASGYVVTEPVPPAVVAKNHLLALAFRGLG